MQFLIAIDQLLNTVFGGFADETLSARVWRMRNNGWMWALTRYLIDGVFFLQEGHCKESYESEINRKQLPVEYRK